jgi:hypothetical protein
MMSSFFAPMPEWPTGEEAQTDLDEPETQRTYTFPGGDQVVLKNVHEIKVRPSGDHRVKTYNRGVPTLHIIPAGWIHIEIKTRSGRWSF